MIISEYWLREWVNPALDTRQLTEQLTMAGLEVDSVAPIARQFTGVVVGEVLAVNAHPDADKLRVCEVADGHTTHQVVCGAPNVRVGIKVPFARVGAEIVTPGDAPNIEIKAAKIRGIESSGMLCSAEELGLAESSEGLLILEDTAQTGVDIRSLLALDDNSIELDLTPNRGDCLSIMGLAREVGVLTNTDVTYPDVPGFQETIPDQLPVNIVATAACPRYLGRVVRNINLNAESPSWMQEKLRRCGLRSIDPVVDVTNYVLLELGQPLHAFDLGKLQGGIEVRQAKPQEKLTLLDGKQVELTAETLVIADAKGAVAMAGIMGGLESAVTESTRDVFLECAFFSPLHIAGKARHYGMHTDASHRYERGVDFQLQHHALQRATQLLLEIVGGEAGPITEAQAELPESPVVELRYTAITKLLGIEIPKSETQEILRRLGIELLSETGDSLRVRAPSYRFDIAIEADLIEELARVYGYNRLPKTPGMLRQKLAGRSEQILDLNRIRNQLTALGYQEVITYSFIEPTLCETVTQVRAGAAVRLQNPISADMSVMRPSLLPGLLSGMKYNENRQQERFRLFETGLVFSRAGSAYAQEARLAGLVAGRKFPNNWSNNRELSDFYDVKGDVESLLDLGGKVGEFAFSPTQHPSLHPGQSAAITVSGNTIGHLGALHPAIQRELGIDRRVYLFEIELSALLRAKIARVKELSRHPEVHRDLAIVIDEDIQSDQILAEVQKHAGEYLTDLRIFDVYQGDAVAKNKKSIALGLTWQHPSRTLSDEAINTIISSCVNALHDKFNADLRN